MTERLWEIIRNPICMNPWTTITRTLPISTTGMNDRYRSIFDACNIAEFYVTVYERNKFSRSSHHTTVRISRRYRSWLSLHHPGPDTAASPADRTPELSYRP